jgi:hypothetical protein
MRMRIRDLVNPGSGIRDGKNQIQDKHPGSATLFLFFRHLARGNQLKTTFLSCFLPLFLYILIAAL